MVATDLGRLLVRCADRPGIVAAVSGFLHRQSANIVESDQYFTDPEDGTFFLRMVFHRNGFDADHEALRTAFVDRGRRAVRDDVATARCVATEAPGDLRLARAVAAHSEDRVLVHGNTTVVF